MAASMWSRSMKFLARPLRVRLRCSPVGCSQHNEATKCLRDGLLSPWIADRPGALSLPFALELLCHLRWNQTANGSLIGSRLRSAPLLQPTRQPHSPKLWLPAHWPPAAPSAGGLLFAGTQFMTDR